MEERYITLAIGRIQAQVKMEDEGVVLDIFEDGEVIESTYAFYHELGIEEIKFESNESI